MLHSGQELHSAAAHYPEVLPALLDAMQPGHLMSDLLTAQNDADFVAIRDILAVASVFANPRVAAVNCRVWLRRYGFEIAGMERMRALQDLTMAARAYMSHPTDGNDAALRCAWLPFHTGAA